jgi:hypothetical protein
MADRSWKIKPNQFLIGCEVCHEKEAVIFHMEGDFCIECWQEKTEPDFSILNYK